MGAIRNLAMVLEFGTAHRTKGRRLVLMRSTEAFCAVIGLTTRLRPWRR
jgi:hypothetical protein